MPCQRVLAPVTGAGRPKPAQWPAAHPATQCCAAGPSRKTSAGRLTCCRRVLHRQQPCSAAPRGGCRGGCPGPRRGPSDQARAPEHREAARAAGPLSPFPGAPRRPAAVGVPDWPTRPARGASSPVRQGVTDSLRSLRIFADHLSETAQVTDRTETRWHHPPPRLPALRRRNRPASGVPARPRKAGAGGQGNAHSPAYVRQRERRRLSAGARRSW
jgi:hypothetical protein